MEVVVMIEEYYDLLERNREFFDRALEIAKEIAEKAKEMFEDCEVYVVGSFARGTHKLSSDLDILIVSDKIPEKIDFEWYSKVVKALTDDYRINIHLVNKEKFEKVEKLYSPRIRVL